MTAFDAKAALYYPGLKRDADRAHAVLHTATCECRDSLEVMASEVRAALETAQAEASPGLVSAAQQAILSLRLISGLTSFGGAEDDVRASAGQAADALEQAIEAARE